MLHYKILQLATAMVRQVCVLVTRLFAVQVVRQAVAHGLTALCHAGHSKKMACTTGIESASSLLIAPTQVAAAADGSSILGICRTPAAAAAAEFLAAVAAPGACAAATQTAHDNPGGDDDDGVCTSKPASPMATAVTHHTFSFSTFSRLPSPSAGLYLPADGVTTWTPAVTAAQASITTAVTSKPAMGSFTNSRGRSCTDRLATDTVSTAIGTAWSAGNLSHPESSSALQQREGSAGSYRSWLACSYSLSQGMGTAAGDCKECADDAVSMALLPAAGATVAAAAMHSAAQGAGGAAGGAAGGKLAVNRAVTMTGEGPSGAAVETVQCAGPGLAIGGSGLPAGQVGWANQTTQVVPVSVVGNTGSLLNA